MRAVVLTSRRTGGAASYLDTEVSSVHVVTKEEIPRVTGGAAHLKQLHQVKELAVHVPTYCTTHRQACGTTNVRKPSSKGRLPLQI